MTRSAARAALGVAVVAAVLLGYWVLVPRDFYTGTNGARARGYVISLKQGEGPLCLPGLRIPAGTGGLELDVSAGRRRPPLALTLRLADGTVLRSRVPAGRGGPHGMRFPFREQRTAIGARGCITVQGPGLAGFGGVATPGFGDALPTVAGRRQTSRLALWWRPPVGEKKAVLFQLTTILSRMALFKPGWTGVWTYWVLLLGVAPALAFAALRLLVAPDRRRRLRLVHALALLGIANGVVWGHMIPAFDTPDEPDHFAYVQSLAERGKPPESVQTARGPWSSQENLGLQATRVLDGAERSRGKPSWSAGDQGRFDRRQSIQPRDDGGGLAQSTRSHSPAYYILGVPLYALTEGDLFNELFAVRLISALLAGIVVACAFLLVRELVPERPRMAVAAAVAVAFQPMFAFMAGSVNNDMGVNAGAAVIVLLLIRLLRRGFRPWPALGLGVAVGITPLLKATGYALYPATLLALGLAVWRYRRRWREWTRGLALTVAGFFAVTLVWSVVSGLFDRTTITTPGGGAPGQGSTASRDIAGAFGYIWQAFLPRLPGMADNWVQRWPALDIFGVRGWGAFGWYAITWDRIVYELIMLVLVALTVLGASLVVRRVQAVRERLPEVLVLLTVIGTVLVVIFGAYYQPTPQGPFFPEQGRYVFPAITALAALFTLSTFGLGRRLAEPVATGLATAVVCLGYASLWLVLGRFFFAV